jgi:hypothetical protein
MPASDTQPCAADALKWLKDLSSRGKQVVFRGQTRIYPSILPSLLRADVSEEDRRIWWAVLRRFISNRDGLTGYRVRSPHDAIAVVQHYLVKSPVVDVTGTPEIALYFALMNRSTEPTRIVYAIDVDAVETAGHVVTDHAFLALPFHDGGLKHRWLRQDGFTIGAADWTTLDGARSLDFARLPGLQNSPFRMQVGEEDLVSQLGDLETTEGDPLATKVRGIFEDIAHHLGCLETVQRLMPSQGTVDGHGSLLAEIDDLIERARKLRLAADDVRQIERFRDAAIQRYWDTSWDCGFESWKAKVAAAGK